MPWVRCELVIEALPLGSSPAVCSCAIPEAVLSKGCVLSLWVWGLTTRLRPVP